MDNRHYVIGGLVLLIGVGVSHAAEPATSQPGQPVSPAIKSHIYEMTDAEVAAYIAWLQANKTTPAERIKDIAARYLGQPYKIPSPLFGRTRSDCVTFTQQVLAMSLADSWESYHRLIVRLTYANGEIPFQPGTYTIAEGRIIPNNRADEIKALLNRNQFIVGQWSLNNHWCLEDITKQLGEGQIKPWIPMHHIQRPKSYNARQGLTVDLPDKKVIDAYIPREFVPDILKDLRTGDVVFVITGTWDNTSCEHLGVIVDSLPGDRMYSAETGPYMVHSAPPKVRCEPLWRFMVNYKFVVGFKFMQLRADAMESAAKELRAMTSSVSVPLPKAN